MIHHWLVSGLEQSFSRVMGINWALTSYLLYLTLGQLMVTPGSYVLRQGFMQDFIQGGSPSDRAKSKEVGMGPNAFF